MDLDAIEQRLAAVADALDNRMTDELCPVCGDTLDVEWIETTRMDDPKPTYLPGRVECPNRCDPRLLTCDDGPIYNAAGQCVSLGLAAEIRGITGDPDATLRSVIKDPDVERRVETLRRIRFAARQLPGSSQPRL